MAGKTYSSFLGAAQALERFNALYKKTVLHEIDRATALAVRLSVSKYMEGGGGGAPANPPPGPLKIRSGKLRRSVRQVKATYRGGVYKGGIKSGGAGLIHPAVHEKGGRRRYIIRPRSKKVLSWIGRDGKRRFARFVRRRPLKPRPYLKPALAEVAPSLVKNVDHALADLARRIV